MGATRVKRHRGNCRTISKRRTWDHSSNVSYILALARQVNLGGKRNNGFGKASWDKISMAMDRARPDLKALTKRRNNIQKRLWELLRKRNGRPWTELDWAQTMEKNKPEIFELFKRVLEATSKTKLAIPEAYKCYETGVVIEEVLSGHSSGSEEEYDESEFEAAADGHSAEDDDNWTETHHKQIPSRFGVGENQAHHRSKMNFVEPISSSRSESSFASAGQLKVPGHEEFKSTSVGRRQVGFSSAVQPIINDSNAYSYQKKFELDQARIYGNPGPYDSQTSAHIVDDPIEMGNEGLIRSRGPSPASPVQEHVAFEELAEIGTRLVGLQESQRMIAVGLIYNHNPDLLTFVGKDEIQFDLLRIPSSVLKKLTTFLESNSSDTTLKSKLDTNRTDRSEKVQPHRGFHGDDLYNNLPVGKIREHTSASRPSEVMLNRSPDRRTNRRENYSILTTQEAKADDFRQSNNPVTGYRYTPHKSRAHSIEYARESLPPSAPWDSTLYGSMSAPLGNISTAEARGLAPTSSVEAGTRQNYRYQEDYATTDVRVERRDNSFYS